MSAGLHIVLVEPVDVDGLYPFSEMHCAWELRVGYHTIAERWSVSVPSCTVCVHTHREAHLASYLERHHNTPTISTAAKLVIRANVILSPSVMQQVADVCAAATAPIVIACNGQIIGAYSNDASLSVDDVASMISQTTVSEAQQIVVHGHVIHRIWQALDHINEAITWDAGLVGQRHHSNASIHPSSVIDESKGPVIIGDSARIDAMSVIVGPTSIGPNAVIRPHALIEHSVLGPGCQAGGEVEGSIMHGWSNKKHAGFLGHSYVCEWVNLGAGCTTSDLKNTYGHVHVTMPWGNEDTQRMFVGLFIGDHSKAAIGTNFLTGTICGVSSNLVADGFPPRAISSFAWRDEAYEVEKALAVARIVMARRSQTLGPATEQLLRNSAGSV